MIEPIPVDVRPDLLAWLTAIGTIGAAVLAAVAIWLTVMDRRQRFAEQRRAQASRISAWVDTQPVVTTPSGDVAVSETVVKVRNGSDDTVYDIWLRPSEKDQVAAVEVGIMDPQSAMFFRVKESILTPGRLPFDLQFVDASGQPWTRHPDGRLTERKRAKSGRSR